MEEIGQTRAFTNARHLNLDHIPYALARLSARTNVKTASEINYWVGEFRPEVFLLVGTAGGVCRPSYQDGGWIGPSRGDVLISEYVHYGDYMRVVDSGRLPRYLRIDQPADDLCSEAGVVLADESWLSFLGSRWRSAGLPSPKAHEVEIVAGEQVLDDPLDAVQQYLMEHFDRAGAVEMESAGLGSALHSLRIDATYAPRYLVVRGCSDRVWARGRLRALTLDDIEAARTWDGISSNESTAERDTWSPLAVEAASAFALALVARIAQRGREALLPHPTMPPVQVALSLQLDTVTSC